MGKLELLLENELNPKSVSTGPTDSTPIDTPQKPGGLGLLLEQELQGHSPEIARNRIEASQANQVVDGGQQIAGQKPEIITSVPVTPEEIADYEESEKRYKARLAYQAMTPQQRWLHDKGYPTDFEPLMKAAPDIDMNANNPFGLMAGMSIPRKRSLDETFRYHYEQLDAEDPLRQKVDGIHALQEAYAKQLTKFEMSQRRQFKGFWDELGRSLASSSLNVANGLTGTLASVSDAAIWDKQQLEDLADWLHEKSQAKSISAPATPEGKWNKVKQFAGNAIGQALPYMTASVVSTAATGTPLAAFGVGFSVEGDNVYREAMEAGASEEHAQMNRLIVGTLNGAIESLQVSDVIKFAKSGKGGVKSIIQAARQQAWKEALSAGKELSYQQLETILRESLEEALQETTSVTAQATVDPTVLENAPQRIGSAALGGGVAGGFLGGAGAVFGGTHVTPEAEVTEKFRQQTPDKDGFRTIQTESQEQSKTFADAIEKVAKENNIDVEIQYDDKSIKIREIQEQKAEAEATQKTEAPVPVNELQNVPVSEVPIKNLKLSKEVLNFKEDSDPETGVVKGEQLAGRYNRLGTAPIIVWQRTNGDMEVITGRHRLDLARRNKEETIPAQIVKESDGFDMDTALTIDAESNIRDGQGKVKDYAQYFRNAGTTEKEAQQRGLLSRYKGKAGFVIGKSLSDDVYPQFLAGKLSERKAYAIAEGAPNNDSAQLAAVAKAGKMSAEELQQYAAILHRTKPSDNVKATQGNLFGFDESALIEAEAVAKEVAKEEKAIKDRILAVKGALKRPETARQMGLEFSDEASIRNEMKRLEDRLDNLSRFATTPELYQEMRRRAGLIEEKMLTQSKPAPKRQTDLLGRPVLQGGTTGKQTEFLDKDDYKTIAEQERINAEDDIEGQQRFDRPEYNTPEHKQYISDAVQKYDKTYANSKTINTDMARRILPGYDPSDISNEEKYFGDAAEVTGKVYDSWLETHKERGNNKIIFLAGGTGSGKSTAANTKALDEAEDYAIQIDSTFTNRDYAFEQIDKAIEAGYTPEIVYVYRNPVDAWEHGVWPRWSEEGGHFVKPQIHLATHIAAKENVIAAGEKYGDKINVEIWENRTGRDTRQISLDELKTKPYDLDAVKEQIDEITSEKLRTSPELTSSEGLYFSDRKTSNEGTEQGSTEVPQSQAGQNPQELIRQKLKSHFKNVSDDQINTVLALWEANANVQGITFDKWIEDNIADVTSGEKDVSNKALFQSYYRGTGDLTGTRTAPYLYQSEQAPVWYSKIQRLIEDKMPPAMQAEQFKNWVKKQDVKDEEIEWSGINDLSGKVTKQGVLDTLAANNIQIEEVQRPSISDADANRLKELQQKLFSGGTFTDADRLDFERIGAISDEGKKPKFSQYTLPGGENYRELLLRLPEESEAKRKIIKGKESRYQSLTDEINGIEKKIMELVRYPNPLQEQKQVADWDKQRDVLVKELHSLTEPDSLTVERYETSHWDESNVLAHVRFDDRTDTDDSRILFIEEIQSDWHQAGRKRGYKQNIEQENFQTWGRRHGLSDGKIERQWGDGGKDYDAWVAAQKEAMNNATAVPDAPFKKSWPELAFKRMLRYAVENGYDKIAWTTGEQQADRYDLSKQIKQIKYRKFVNGNIDIDAITKDGREIPTQTATKENLDTVVGKDLATKILESDKSIDTFSGLDLKVGGEGMKGFYDQIIPSFANKYTKKWGGKVGETILEIPDETAKNYEAEKSEDGTWYLAGRYGETLAEGFESEDDAYDFLRETGKTDTVHSLDIIPSMADAVMKGQSLFQDKKAAVQFLPDGKAVIHAFESADISSLVHETGHIFRRQLEPDDKATVERLFGIKDGKWTTNKEERFARSFERYMRDGKAPSAKLADIFQKFKEWLTAIYKSITAKSPLNIKISPELRQVFDNLLAKKETDLLYQKETPPDVQEFLRKKHNLAPLTVVKDTKDAENILDGYFAERDEKEMEANVDAMNLQNRIKEATNSKKYGKEQIKADMAIQVYIDLKNNPDQLKYYDKLNRKQKAIVDLAQNLPAELKTIADEIIKLNNDIGLDALDKGIISNVLDNYSMRLWENEKQQGSGLFRKFGTKTARAKQRTLEGILHGWSLGKELKIKGATNAHAVMASQVSSTIVDRQLLKTAKEWGLISDKQIGEDWVRIEHPNFTDWKWSGKADNAQTYGKNFFITEDGNLMEKLPMYATPELGKHLNNALGTSALYGIPGIETATRWNAALKRWILFTSFFHHQAFVRSYTLGGKTGFAKLSPRKAYKAGKQAIENFIPELRRGVRNGLTLGKIQDYDETALKGKTVFGRMADHVPGLKQVKDGINTLRDKNEKWLFGKLGPYLKAQAFLLEYKSLSKKYDKQLKSGEKTLDDLAKIAANLVNDDFGGLHLARMGRNPTLQHIFRLLALAPDWTESNVRSAVKAFKTGEEGKVYRAFWARIAFKGLVASVLFNYLMSLFDDDEDGDFVGRYKQAWKNGKMRWMDVDITPIYRMTGGKADKRKYFSILGHFKDPAKFIAREKTKGGVPDPVRSLIKSAQYKGSVLTRMMADGISGKDYKGSEFTTLAELLGIDDKGTYKTNRKGYYTKGDPKGGKLVGELTKWSMGGMKPLGLGQIPSFLIYEARQSVPIQIQNGISYTLGQMDGFDAVLSGAGIHISSTYDPAEKYKDQTADELTAILGNYVYADNSQNRKLGRVGQPHIGKEHIVKSLRKMIDEKQQGE